MQEAEAGSELVGCEDYARCEECEKEDREGGVCKDGYVISMRDIRVLKAVVLG